MQLDAPLRFVDPTTGQEEVVGGKIRQVINLVRALPVGMTVYKTSMAEILRVNIVSFNPLINRVREELERLHSEHTIWNANGVRGEEARFAWKKVAELRGGGLTKASQRGGEEGNQGSGQGARQGRSERRKGLDRIIVSIRPKDNRLAGPIELSLDREKLDAEVNLGNGEVLENLPPELTQLVSILRNITSEMMISERSLAKALGVDVQMLGINVKRTNGILLGRRSMEIIGDSTIGGSLEPWYFWKTPQPANTGESPGADTEKDEGLENDQDNNKGSEDSEAGKNLAAIVTNAISNLKSPTQFLSLLSQVELTAEEIASLEAYNAVGLELAQNVIPDDNQNANFTKVPLNIVRPVRLADAVYTGRLDEYRPNATLVINSDLRMAFHNAILLLGIYQEIYPDLNNLGALVLSIKDDLEEKIRALSY